MPKDDDIYQDITPWYRVDTRTLAPWRIIGNLSGANEMWATPWEKEAGKWLVMGCDIRHGSRRTAGYEVITAREAKTLFDEFGRADDDLAEDLDFLKLELGPIVDQLGITIDRRATELETRRRLQRKADAVFKLVDLPADQQLPL
jgi:hypothetical protein